MTCPMNLMWTSDPLKRYPDGYRAIFHMLPIGYKKPGLLTSKQDAERGARDVSSDFISIDGRRRTCWSFRLSCTPAIFISKTQSHKHVLYEAVVLSVMLAGFLLKTLLKDLCRRGSKQTVTNLCSTHMLIHLFI